jgi:hypothetical protein
MPPRATSLVIAGLDPAIQSHRLHMRSREWMPGSSPGMTKQGVLSPPIVIAGLDPAIQPHRLHERGPFLDARVEPGHDNGEGRALSTLSSPGLTRRSSVATCTRVAVSGCPGRARA